MFTRKLGRSGIEVSAMGLGCWPIGGLIMENGRSVGWGAVNDNESVRAIHRAMELMSTFLILPLYMDAQKIFWDALSRIDAIR